MENDVLELNRIPFAQNVVYGGHWSGLLAKAGAFLRKDIAIAASYKLQFVFQFSQVFFSIAVIYFIGKMLHASGNSPLLARYGADYFSFAIVGLAINSYMKAGIVNVTNDIRQTMNQGVLEAIFATPTSYGILLLYSALWPFVFTTIRVVFYILCGMVIFGLKFPHANWLGAILVLSLSVPIFLMLGVMSSSILVLVKRGDPVNWFFSSISGILAGTMFPITVLPSWLQRIALCLPLTHALEAMRRCLLTGSSVYQVRANLFSLVCFVLILLPITMIVSRQCMRKAKKLGTFTTY